MIGEKVFVADQKSQDMIIALCREILGHVDGDVVDAKSKVAAQYFTLRRTGREWGVKFPNYSVSPVATGQRTRNAVGMEAYPSTDSLAARNDFDSYSVFNGLECNGYVDATTREFVVTYFKGEDGYSETENDKWVLFGTHWFKVDFTDGEEDVITDTPKEGFCPEGAAIRADGTIRPFVAIAAYGASEGSDGKAASVSGRMPYYNMSHNTCITKATAKGAQYCMTTQQDRAHMDMLFLITFATRNSQSIMAGATSYYLQYAVAVAEENVERVVVTNAQASGFVIGSIVSIGDKGSNESPDRGNSYMHNIVNRKQITAIEDIGDGKSAIYVDNGGTKFTTTKTTYISTMPWKTGETDSVLGTCGSPVSNTSGKFPYKLYNVEYAWGQYEVVSNVVMKITNGVMKPHICYDCKLLSTSAPTEAYNEVNMVIPNNGGSWKYVAELGYDPAHPTVRYGVTVGATSSTGYCDGQYTEDLTGNLNGSREVLVGGSLDGGADAGRCCAYLLGGLGVARWFIAARLSASGSCAAA